MKIAHWLESNLREPQAAQQQRLLNLILLGLAAPGALFGLVMLFLWILRMAPLAAAITGLGVQPFYALSYWLARQGKVTFAAYIPVGAVFLAMAGASFYLGIGHVTYVGFAMATLTAGILLGNSAGLFVSILSTVAYLVIGILQASGQLITTIEPRFTVVADTIGMGLGLVVLVIFTSIYGNELKKALLMQQALSAELKVDQANLEKQIRRRTRDLERRMVQIRTAAEISRAISAVLDTKKLLQQVVDLLQERLDLYYAGVFLLERDSTLDSQGEYAVLQAGTGEAGHKMLPEGHKLAVVEHSMIGWTIIHRQPRIALDVDQENVRFNTPHLPLTRSEMTLPILSGDRCLGAITIQSEQPDAFDQDDITMLQAIADSLATALENARLYQQAQASLEEIRSLHRQYLSRAWGEAGLSKDEAHFTYQSDQPISPGIQSSMTEFPLTLRDQVIGNMTIQRDGQPLSPDEKALIEAIATETTIALENARLMDETQRQARRERLLADIFSKVRSSSDIEMILRTAIQELGRSLRASEGIIRLNLKE